MSDRAFITGIVQATVLVLIGIFFGRLGESNQWKKSIIKRDLAYYHPATKEFTWKEFKEVKWEKVEK